MTVQVKDLGEITQIARYKTREYPAELIFVPNDEVAALIKMLTATSMEREAARRISATE